MKYTTFCREDNDQGTTHITCVEADSLEGAMRLGVEQCCNDWNGECGANEDDHVPCYSSDNVICIGVIAGDVEILYWEDLSAQWL